MIRLLYLDLEDTIITPVTDGWWKTELINVGKVKKLIDEIDPDLVHVFSFAIWNRDELAKFNASGTQGMIEGELGIRLSMVPTVDDDIIPSCTKVAGLWKGTVSFSDMSEFWGKHEAFRLYMRALWGPGGVPIEVILLDDAVINEEFFWPELKIRGRIINVDGLS